MKKAKTIAIALLTLAVLPAAAQQTRGLIREMRFENQPITDILPCHQLLRHKSGRL